MGKVSVFLLVIFHTESLKFMTSQVRLRISHAHLAFLSLIFIEVNVVLGAEYYFKIANEQFKQTERLVDRALSYYCIVHSQNFWRERTIPV